MLLCDVAHSQDVSNVAIEGHVFDAKTQKPLENALVSYDVTAPGGLGGGFATNSDTNGFYEMEFLPFQQPLASATLNVLCRTRKGDVQVFSKIYTSVRTEIYRRDFYITLPKNMSKCNP